MATGKEPGVAIARVARVGAHRGEEIPGDLPLRPRLGDLTQLWTCAAVRPSGASPSFRMLGPGEIEIFIDTTRDPLSTPEWTRTMCRSIRQVDQDPNGVPILIGDECDEPVVNSD